jgi:hypothetical protein
MLPSHIESDAMLSPRRDLRQRHIVVVICVGKFDNTQAGVRVRGLKRQDKHEDANAL